MRFLAIAAVALALSLMTAVREASACSCVRESTPCASFQSGNPDLLIFVGTPKFVVAASRDLRRFTFVVDERLKGAVTDTIEIETQADTAACGYPFDVGTQYLVYAFRASDGVRVSMCSRTGPVASRLNDLALFKEVSSGRVQSRLKVTVARYDLLLGGGYHSYAPDWTGLPDVPVTVRGPAASREIQTDANGSFTLVGLPPGTYAVEARLPSPYVPRFERVPTVDLGGCLAETFIPVSRLSVGGILRTEDGRPAGKSVRLRAARLDAGNRISFRQTTLAFTDEQGRWSLAGLPAGRYVIGVNIYDAPSVDTPYEAVWYPRVRQAAEATVIDVTDTASQTIDFRLPAPLASVTITGRVMDESGQPVAEATVLLYDDDDLHARESFKSRVAHAVTDKLGQFTVTGFAGHRYHVEASVDPSYGRVGTSAPTRVSAQAPTDVIVAIRAIPGR